MTQTEMKEMARNLGEDERCPICRNAGQIGCDAHKVEVDEDGWCLRCDGPAGPERIMCYCQDA